MTIKDLEIARAKLQANDPSTGLPGREDKLEELINFLTERLMIRRTAAEKKAKLDTERVTNIIDRHENKTVFVCGVPGTGKTAVVMQAVEALHKQLAPQKVYSEIMNKMTNIHCTPEKAQDFLETIFTSSDPGPQLAKLQSKTRSSSKKRTPIDKDMRYVVIIDELDMLYNERRQNVFYSLFDWPTSHSSRMILITIANAMDLPERYMRGRIGSRLGWNKIVFEPYSSKHLESILLAKLGTSLMTKCFDKNAILVATKRIGKTTGDARRILDTCCLALDEAIEEKSTKVTSAIVDRVGFQNLDLMKTDYVRECPPLELMILKAILNESAAKGEDNIYAEGVYTQVVNMTNNASHMWIKDIVLAYDEFHELLNTLQAVGLIAIDDQKSLLEKRLFIIDTSESFRDVIRLTQLNVL